MEGRLPFTLSRRCCAAYARNGKNFITLDWMMQKHESSIWTTQAIIFYQDFTDLSLYQVPREEHFTFHIDFSLRAPRPVLAAPSGHLTSSQQPLRLSQSRNTGYCEQKRRSHDFILILAQVISVTSMDLKDHRIHPSVADGLLTLL